MVAGDREPRVIQYFKWATIIIAGITAIGGALGFIIVLMVRWAATPIVETKFEELEKKMMTQITDTKTQIAATNTKLDLVAAGMKYTENDPRRRQILNYVPKVKTNPASLPPPVLPPPAEKPPQ